MGIIISIIIKEIGLFIITNIAIKEIELLILLLLVNLKKQIVSQ